MDVTDDTLASPPAESVPTYSRTRPFPAVLLTDVILNGRGSTRETHHLEVSVAGSGFAWEPGDSVGIYPTNDPNLVASLLETLGFSGDESVEVGEDTFSLRAALLRHLECTTITRSMMTAYARLLEAEALQELLSPQQRAAFYAYTDGRDVLDLLIDYPLAGLGAQDFVNCLRKMPPRLYSIASSPRRYPEEVHLTVVAVRYHAHHRVREGVCSTYLADRLFEEPAIPLFISPNLNFRLPADPATPILMIGPGTGVAPFRAFVQERAAAEASGKSWLFFGNQHRSTDFLYQAEWERYLAEGVLTRLDVAFSRDQAEKYYVQHCLLEQSREVYGWIREGAHMYVCGDLERMAPGVHDALSRVLQKEAGLSPEAAEEELKSLRRAKRYVRDVY